MRFVKKAAMWVGYLALGCLLSYAQDVKSQDVLTEKATVPSDIEEQIAQIGKASTVILAVRLDPNLAEAYKIRGDAKSNLGNHNTAIIDYDIAIHLKPDYTEAYYKRGSAKLEIGDVSEAKIDFRTALKLAESEDIQSLKDKIEKFLHLLR